MRRQDLAASSASLKAKPRNVLRETLCLVRVGRRRRVANVDSIGLIVRAPSARPERRRGEQGVAVLPQLLGHLRIFGPVDPEVGVFLAFHGAARPALICLTPRRLQPPQCSRREALATTG